PGPEVGPPGAAPPDLGADDRLGEQAQAEDQEAGRKEPVDMLSGRLHGVPRGPPTARAARRNRREARPRSRAAAARRTATKSPGRADAAPSRGRAARS